MYSDDFEYDGLTLSSFGFVVCEFDGSGDLRTGNSGSEITFVLSPIQSGKRQVVAGSKYEKCLTATFQICKDPDTYIQEEMGISAEEFRELSRWLNRREYLWFRCIDNCPPERDYPWVRASFTLTPIEIDNTMYGVELNMTTDSPFGYGDLVTETLSFTAGNLTKTVMDKNDEIGESYPAVTIRCGQSGTITLSNAMTGCATSVDNCVSNETISLSGDTMIVTTNSATHKLADDFNYDFFRIGNTYGNRTNTITASAPCTVTISYRPIYKDVI